MLDDEDIVIIGPFMKQYQDLMREKQQSAPLAPELVEGARKMLLERVKPERKGDFGHLGAVSYYFLSCSTEPDKYGTVCLQLLFKLQL